MTLEDLTSRALANPEAAIRELDKLDCEGSLIEFVKKGWHALEPHVKFVPGWAVEAMAEHLEAVSNGQIKRLLINVPPGCTKSMLVNVFWPAWEWGPRERPDLRYISASYATELSIRDNLRCRDLMMSEWYRGYWGKRFGFKSDQNAKLRFENTKAGWRFASSVGANLTGHRGDRIIIDDPHSVQKVESQVDRETALRWFAETLPTRLNNLEESAIVVIMQRVHERDVSGLILAKELGYDHLCLPMQFEPDHPHLSRTSLGFVDPRKEPGEWLWPERFSPVEIGKLKEQFQSFGGSYAEAGQLQQRPAPRGGGMFQRKDFHYLDEAPREGKRCRGWDLAATKDGHGAFTVGVKMCRTPDGKVVIEDVRRGRWGPGDVKTNIRACAEADGYSVIQDLPQDPGQAGKAQKADLAALLAGFVVHFGLETGSKEDRARPLAAQCEAGNVYLVRAPWNDSFVSEATMFPNGEFKDQIDAASRSFARLIARREQYVGTTPVQVVS